MALLHGKNGKVVWNAEDAANDVDISTVTLWNLDVTADTAENSNMTTSWKTFLGGLKGGTCTVECNAQAAEPEVPYLQSWAGTYSKDGLGDAYEIDAGGDPTTQRVYIELWFGQVEANGIIYGPVIATGISHSVDMNDVAKVIYTFQMNGTITYTATEPVSWP